MCTPSDPCLSGACDLWKTACAGISRLGVFVKATVSTRNNPPKAETETQDKRMNMNSYKIWALLGAAGGAGFGLFAAPLVYILINLGSDGITFGETARFAVANGATWGVLGLFAGVFLGVVNRVQNPPAED